MKEEKILYEIKSLEKMIFRALVQETELKEISNHHPTPTQMQIMEYILKHQNTDIFQKDLEKVLNLRRATVSGVLQTMEKNELIERVIDPLDARTKKVILNPKAKKMFQLKEAKISELENAIIQDIQPKDLEIFSNVLKQMKENLKKYMR